MRLPAQAILLLFTGCLPVAYAFLKLQAITGSAVANGCSKEQLSHLIESVRQASEAAHNTASTLRSARDHSFAAVEVLLGGQYYDDASTKETFAAAVTNHVINVAFVLSQTLGTASELSPHKDTLNFACPLEQAHPIVVETGTSGIRNILNMGPYFFKMSSKSIVDKNAYDAAKKTSTHSRIFAQMPPFTSAPCHLLRMIPKSAIFHSLPVPATPLSLHTLAGHSLQADGIANCILKQLDEEPFVPCNPTCAKTTRSSMGPAVRKRGPADKPAGIKAYRQKPAPNAPSGSPNKFLAMFSHKPARPAARPAARPEQPLPPHLVRFMKDMVGEPTEDRHMGAFTESPTSSVPDLNPDHSHLHPQRRLRKRVNTVQAPAGTTPFS